MKIRKPASTLAKRTKVLWCGNARTGSGNGWSFPPRVRRHLEQECRGLSVLHLFGGMATFGTRLDKDPIVQMNAQVKTALFRAAGWIARKRVIWFSTQWMAATGGLKAERAWLIRVGDSCQVRCLQYFKIAERPGPVRYFKRGPAMKYNRWLAGNMQFNFDAKEQDDVSTEADRLPRGAVGDRVNGVDDVRP